MGLLVIGIIILILGTIFNRMMRVEPLPAQTTEVELDDEIGGWSRLETIGREIENGGNRDLVNSERGENAPPTFYGYSNDYQSYNAMSDSSEKVLTDFTSETYVFGSSLYDSSSLVKNDDAVVAKEIAFNDTLSKNKKRGEVAVNFNMRDAVIFSAILNPKFKEENQCEKEILI